MSFKMVNYHHNANENQTETGCFRLLLTTRLLFEKHSMEGNKFLKEEMLRKENTLFSRKVRKYEHLKF